MRRVKLFFWTFLFVLTGVEIIADESNENLNQEKNGISGVSGQENNSTKNVSQPGEGGNNTNVVNFNDSFLSEEKEEGKVSEEEIAANQSILNESVEENQSGFLGWLGRFFGNIFDEINTDRIVDSIWNKSTMKHEGDEEYNAAKDKIDKHLIKKAFRGLLRKYLAGGEINEGTIQKFNGQYDKVKMFADMLKKENNDFEDDSLRLIILEKVLGGRGDDIHSVLAALDNVSEDKIAELQSLMAELKANEEEFVKCFADMSAVEKYNLERAAFYDKKGNYCKSQWMMVDKNGIHEASRGFVTWVKNIWKVLRFVIGFGVNVFVIVVGFILKVGLYRACWGSKKYLAGGTSDNNDVGICIFKVLQIITCLPSFIYRGCTHNIVQDIVAVIDSTILLIGFFHEKFIGWITSILSIDSDKCNTIINIVAVVCAGISIFLNFLDGLFGLKHVFNKKINKHLAFLLNKKFRYIKNYVETLKKIHVLINGDEVLAGAFKKELLSLEKVFGDEASNETKHMLTEMDKQKLYDSFDDVEDTGEAMLLFDKNKDIFSDCIVDVNKINACVELKVNVPAEENKNKENKSTEKNDVKETIDNQEENKKKENEPVEKKDVKETIDNQEENKEKENEPVEKKDVKETIDNQEENKKEENKPAEKSDVKEHTANQDGNKNKANEHEERKDVKEETAKQEGVNIGKIKEEEQIEESITKTTLEEPSARTQNKSKKNKKRINNKKRKKKRSAKKRQAKTSENKNKNKNNKKSHRRNKHESE